MKETPAIVAVLFADIAKSTALYEKLGNSAAQKLIGVCLSAMSNVCTMHGGRVVKTIGDEIMCAFPTAVDAVNAAMVLQSAVENIPPTELPDNQAPDIHVGIHYGPIIENNNDIFGDAVNVAARMVSIAKQRQIITTRETVEALPAEYTDCVRCIDKAMVKGKMGELFIYEVICEKETATVMLKAFPAAKPAVKHHMELSFSGVSVEINGAHPVATMGRQAQNDIVVNDNRVSRFHARIEYRREKYILIDQSTNGTYVAEYGSHSILLNRDEIQLDGSGVIDLCNEATPISPTAIHYAVKAYPP